jgi:exopolysaccharide biosynthesis predicted pyruvyltransferase EpsI
VKQKIGDVLRDWVVPGETLHFYPNPGNSGDALIAAATWQMFDRLGFSPSISKPIEFQQGASVILGGGGNLVPLYSDMRRALERCLEMKVGRCLLLPHTIRGHEQLLSRLDGRFTLCCRDIPSFEHVVRQAPHAIPILADDMVFSIDISVLEKRAATLRHRSALLFDRDWQKSVRRWRRALALCNPDEKGVLTILRVDREVGGGAERENVALDLPDHYRMKHGGRAGCDQVAVDLFRCLRRAKYVVTDRLHIALPSVLLGVPLEIIDNSYGKLSAVFNLSLPGNVVVREQSKS